MTDDLRNIELERQFLGALLVAESMPHELRELDASIFSVERNRWIFEAIQQRALANQPFDLILVADDLDGTVDAAYIASLSQVGVGLRYLDEYAELLTDLAERRRLLSIYTDAARAVINGQDYDLAGVLRAASEARPVSAGVHSIGDVAGEIYTALAAAKANPREYPGFDCGYRDINRMLGGVEVGKTTYLSGDPGAGKTTLGIQVCYNLAAQGVPVLILSLEMTRQRLIERMLSQRLKLSPRAMATGQISQDQLEQALGELTQGIGSLPIYIADPSGVTLRDLRALVQRYVDQRGIQFVLIDSFGKITDRPSSNMHESETYIATGLSGIVKDYNIASWVIYGVTKDGLTTQRKTMANMRGSSNVLHEADSVLFVQEDAENERQVVVMPAKLRDGEGKMFGLFVRAAGYPALLEDTAGARDD